MKEGLRAKRSFLVFFLFTSVEVTASLAVVAYESKLSVPNALQRNKTISHKACFVLRVLNKKKTSFFNFK